MRKIIFTLIITILPFLSVSAQESEKRVSANAGIAISEIGDLAKSFENSRTFVFGAKVNVLPTSSGWTLSPTYDGQITYNTEVLSGMAYPDGLYRDVITHFGGIEIAKKASYLRIGGGFFLGTRKSHPDLDRVLVRKYKAFVDVDAGYFIFRPFFAELEAQGRFDLMNLTSPNRSTRYGASVAFKLF